MKYAILLKIKKGIIFCMVLILASKTVYGDFTCSGRLVNPISDICWSCILPISIGATNVGKGRAPKKRDTQNPSSPFCACIRGSPPVPIPGISLGFWEPVRLIEVTRTPYCMVSLGGLQIAPVDHRKVSSYNRSYNKKISHNSFYHLHYYVYPLIYWLELITDLVCLEKSTFDVAYLSELDPTWNDHKLQTLFNPEAFLFGNPAAQAACAFDCSSATIDKAKDELFWCTGCWGNLYPFSGANADHVGGVQSSSLYASRILAKMHRIGVAEETSTTDGSVNGKLCRKNLALKIKKSQYKLQMLYPKSTSGDIGCWPLGCSDLMYSSFKEYPYDGQDWGYLVWRKKNCCAF